MVIKTRKSLKDTLLEGLGKVGSMAFPLVGIPKQTYIEKPLSGADKLNQEASRLIQLADQEKDINRKRELYRQSLNLSQQASKLSQQAASNVPKLVGATQLGVDVLGATLGGTLGAVSKGAKALKGVAQSTSGGVSNLIASKLLPEQMKAVEEQRLKDVVQTYRQKYPQANISTTLPIEQQEKAYKEYIKAPYTKQYKPTLPAGYQEPETITGQSWEGVRSGTLNTLLPAIIKSTQSVLNKVGLYDVAGQLENKTQQLQAYAQSRLDLQSPDFAKMFKENPTKASVLYVARAFGETLPYTGAMVVTPLLTRKVNYWTTVAPLKFIEKGNFLRDIENTVQDKTVADSLATIYGGINAVIENSLGYTPAGLAKWLSKPIQQVSQNSFLKVVKSLPRKVVSVLMNSINEGNEEVLQQITENILRKWAGDKNVQTTFSELAQNWLGGFAGSLPLGVSNSDVTNVGLTVQPIMGREIIGKTDKSGATIINVTPLENTYIVNYVDETGKSDGFVFTPEEFKKYIQTNFPEVQITSKEIPSQVYPIMNERDRLLEQNEQINEQLDRLESSGQVGTSEYINLENKREQNGKKIRELTEKINKLQEAVVATPQAQPQPVETPKVEEEAKKQGQIFYHGTNQLFSHFEEGVSDSSGAGVSNAGVFLTEDKESANWWAKYAALEGGTPNVKEVFADVKNTKVFKTRQSFENFIDKFDTPEEAVEYLKKQGYDSISYPENIAETFSPEYFDTLSRQLGKTFGPLHKTTRVLQVFDPKNVYILKEGKKQITTIQDIYRNKRQKEQLFKQKFGPFIDKAKESPNLQAFLGKLSTNELADLFNAVQRGDIEGVNSMQDFYNQAVKGAKQETRTELQPKQMPPQPEETQPVVEKAIPVVEENLPETTSFAINQALLRLAKQQGIPVDQLPTHEVENMKQISQATADFYDSLSPEQKDEYIQNGQLPATVSKPIFSDLYEREYKDNLDKIRLLLNSPIYEELTEAGQLLREQREVVNSRIEVVQTIQKAKRQRVSKRLGVKSGDLANKIKVVNRKLTHRINLQTLSDIVAKHPQLRNPKLVDAVRLGEINLLELTTHPYEDIVKTLSPYIQDPELLRQAALELQGKQFLQRIGAGVTYWIKKWGVAEPSLSDKQLIRLVNQLLAQLQPKQLTWQEQQKTLKQFTETLSGYILSDEELKKAMEIADVLITARGLPDFETLPEDNPEIVKYAQAELAYLHLKKEMEGENTTLPQWWQEVNKTISSTWEEYGFWQGFWEATGVVFKELNDLSISLVANIDNSFIGRQGSYTIFTNPKAWLGGAKKSFEAWLGSNPAKVIDAYLLDYFKDPLYRNGFYTKVGVANVNLELYPSLVPDKFPVIGRSFQKSTAAFTLSQTDMRRRLARSMWNVYQGYPVTIHGETQTLDLLTDKTALKDLKEIIGVSTASGLSIKNNPLHYVIWSPSFIVADFKTLSNLIGAWTSKNPEFRKLQIKQAWTRLIGVVAFQYLMNILLRSIYKDWDENPIVFDPTDQRFGEIYLGKDIKYRHPLLTLVNLFCTIGSTALGKGYRSRTTRERVKVGQYGFDPFGDLVVGYFKNKFTPVTSILVQIINNEMFGGKKITAIRVGETLFAPITLQNIFELKDVEKWRQPSAILAIIADAFGLNTTTMIHSVQLEKTIADEIDRLQGLEIPDVQSGRYDGFINEFKALSVKENQRFFEVLSEQLNKQLTQLIESQPYQAASDEQKADAIQRLYDNIFSTTKIYWMQHKLNQCKTQEEGYKVLHDYTKQGFINDELYQDLVKYGVIPYSLIQYAQSKQK